MTPWLELCRAAVEDVRGVLAELPGRAEREPVIAAGVGGDDTTAVDAAAERVVVERLRSSQLGFTLVSEELGEEVVGDGGSTWVVLDPIDGSNNAKRGIPHFSLSVAVADGPTMADVRFGYVYDFGAREEWTATRGAGAFLDGAALDGQLPKDELEILAFEATTTRAIAERAGAMVGIAHRLRIMGSLAIALCQLAAGRLDGVCSLKAARSVDIAAAQLLVRERGLAIELFDGAEPFGAAPLDVEARSRVAAAGSPELCRRLAGHSPRRPRAARAAASRRDVSSAWHQTRPFKPARGGNDWRSMGARGEVRIGCSGWNYAHWRERVYPKGCPASRWLEHYATLFDTVEVNATFYRLPRPPAVARWVEQTPPSFVFTVKASRYLTHIKRLTDLGSGVERFYCLPSSR